MTTSFKRGRAQQTNRLEPRNAKTTRILPVIAVEVHDLADLNDLRSDRVPLVLGQICATRVRHLLKRIQLDAEPFEINVDLCVVLQCNFHGSQRSRE
eukprot:1485555-Pyramimonas_sp.AAC.1